MKRFRITIGDKSDIVKAENAEIAKEIFYDKHIKDAISTTEQEKLMLLRRLRENIKEELDAVTSYEDTLVLASNLDLDDVVTILKDIRNEERAHVGELQKIIHLIDKNEKQLVNEGFQEASEILNKEEVK